MATGDKFRDINPQDCFVTNAAGAIVGVQAGADISTAARLLNEAQVSALTTFLASTNGTGASVSSGYTGGATPWTKLYGPNEFRQAPWTSSAELTGGTPHYTTPQSPANGPCMARREMASMLFEGPNIAAGFGNFRNFSATIPAGLLQNKTIGMLVYCHRMDANFGIRLRIGTNTGDYVQYRWYNSYNNIQEGWNFLLVSTAEVIHSIASPGAANGQISFQTGGTVNEGWQQGAGTTFNFSQAIGYVAIDILNITPQQHFSLEGIYYGGQDKPQVTIGFDIQGAELNLALPILQKYGLVGYLAVPTANGVPANPEYLWTAADVARLQLWYAGGNEIIQHSSSHTSANLITDETALALEYESCREQIRAIGCYSGADLYAAPNGAFSNRAIAIAAKVGNKWGRMVTNAPLMIGRGLIGLANPLLQGAVPLNSANSEAAVIARALAFFDLLIQYRCSGHAYTHGVITGASNSIQINSSTLEAICAGLASRIAAGQIECVIPSRFIRESNTPNIDVAMASYNRLAITAGVSPYNLQNTGYKPLRFLISGGTVSAIALSRDTTTFDSTGSTAGSFDLNPGDILRITYTAAPAITQYST